MNICWMGFVGRNMSWSIVAQNLCREFIKLGHNFYIFYTNGALYFPDDLKPNLKGYIEENTQITNANYQDLIGSKLDTNYDMQLSYTAFKNFEAYLSRGTKNRFGIWNYETTVIPKAFIKHCYAIDKYVAEIDAAMAEKEKELMQV